jgi:hypothetical protein
MSDTLVRLLSDHQPRPFPDSGFGCTGCVGRFVTRGDHARHVADLIAAEFLVVPRSQVDVEYGVEFRSIVHGPAKNADVARYRAVHVYETAPDAARQREVWAGPWKPLDENGGKQ